MATLNRHNRSLSIPLTSVRNVERLNDGISIHKYQLSHSLFNLNHNPFKITEAASVTLQAYQKLNTTTVKSNCPNGTEECQDWQQLKKPPNEEQSIKDPLNHQFPYRSLFAKKMVFNHGTSDNYQFPAENCHRMRYRRMRNLTRSTRYIDKLNDIVPLHRSNSEPELTHYQSHGQSLGNVIPLLALEGFNYAKISNSLQMNFNNKPVCSHIKPVLGISGIKGLRVNSVSQWKKFLARKRLTAAFYSRPSDLLNSRSYSISCINDGLIKDCESIPKAIRSNSIRQVRSIDKSDNSYFACSTLKINSKDAKRELKSLKSYFLTDNVKFPFTTITQENSNLGHLFDIGPNGVRIRKLYSSQDTLCEISSINSRTKNNLPIGMKRCYTISCQRPSFTKLRKFIPKRHQNDSPNNYVPSVIIDNKEPREKKEFTEFPAMGSNALYQRVNLFRTKRLGRSKSEFNVAGKLSHDNESPELKYRGHDYRDIGCHNVRKMSSSNISLHKSPIKLENNLAEQSLKTLCLNIRTTSTSITFKNPSLRDLYSNVIKRTLNLKGKANNAIDSLTSIAPEEKLNQPNKTSVELNLILEKPKSADSVYSKHSTDLQENYDYRKDKLEQPCPDTWPVKDLTTIHPIHKRQNNFPIDYFGTSFPKNKVFQNDLKADDTSLKRCQITEPINRFQSNNQDNFNNQNSDIQTQQYYYEGTINAPNYENKSERLKSPYFTNNIKQNCASIHYHLNRLIPKAILDFLNKYPFQESLGPEFILRSLEKPINLMLIDCANKEMMATLNNESSSCSNAGSNIDNFICFPTKGKHGKSNVSEIKRVLIILLNGQSLEISCNLNTLVKELLELALEFMKVTEREYFGLTYIKDTEHIFLDNEEKLGKICPPAWKNSPNHQSSKHKIIGSRSGGIPLTFNLFVRIKFYVDDINVVTDPLVLHQHYLQVRKDILERRITCLDEEVLTLASSALQTEFGDQSFAWMGSDASSQISDGSSKRNLNQGISIHSPSNAYFIVEHYVPRRLIAKYGLKFLYDRLKIGHEALKGMSRSQAEINFLREAQTLREYGIHFYKVFKSQNKSFVPIYLGISSSGLMLVQDHTFTSSIMDKLNDVDIAENRNLIAIIPWVNVEKISFDHNRFRIQKKFTKLPREPLTTPYADGTAKRTSSLFKGKFDQNSSRPSSSLMILNHPTNSLSQKHLNREEFYAENCKKGRYLLKLCESHHKFYLSLKLKRQYADLYSQRSPARFHDYNLYNEINERMINHMTLTRNEKASFENTYNAQIEGNNDTIKNRVATSNQIRHRRNLSNPYVLGPQDVARLKFEDSGCISPSLSSFNTSLTNSPNYPPPCSPIHTNLLNHHPTAHLNNTSPYVHERSTRTALTGSPAFNNFRTRGNSAENLLQTENLLIGPSPPNYHHMKHLTATHVRTFDILPRESSYMRNPSINYCHNCGPNSEINGTYQSENGKILENWYYPDNFQTLPTYFTKDGRCCEIGGGYRNCDIDSMSRTHCHPYMNAQCHSNVHSIPFDSCHFKCNSISNTFNNRNHNQQHITNLDDSSLIQEKKCYRNAQSLNDLNALPREKPLPKVINDNTDDTNKKILNNSVIVNEGLGRYCGAPISLPNDAPTNSDTLGSNGTSSLSHKDGPNSNVNNSMERDSNKQHSSSGYGSQRSNCSLELPDEVTISPNLRNNAHKNHNSTTTSSRKEMKFKSNLLCHSFDEEPGNFNSAYKKDLPILKTPQIQNVVTDSLKNEALAEGFKKFSLKFSNNNHNGQALLESNSLHPKNLDGKEFKPRLISLPSRSGIDSSSSPESSNGNVPAISYSGDRLDDIITSFTNTYPFYEEVTETPSHRKSQSELGNANINSYNNPGIADINGSDRNASSLRHENAAKYIKEAFDFLDNNNHQDYEYATTPNLLSDENFPSSRRSYNKMKDNESEIHQASPRLVNLIRYVDYPPQTLSAAVQNNVHSDIPESNQPVLRFKIRKNQSQLSTDPLNQDELSNTSIPLNLNNVRSTWVKQDNLEQGSQYQLSNFADPDSSKSTNHITDKKEMTAGDFGDNEAKSKRYVTFISKSSLEI